MLSEKDNSLSDYMSEKVILERCKIQVWMWAIVKEGDFFKYELEKGYEQHGKLSWEIRSEISCIFVY